MKLPQCEYPSQVACGGCAAPLKRVFNVLWTALDGKLDLDNFSDEIFSEQFELIRRKLAGRISHQIRLKSGSGSGLDADTLDGRDSTYFQPLDAELTALAGLISA